MTRLGSLFCAGAIALATGIASTSLAADDPGARAERSNELLKEGERLYAAGKYRESAETLEQAFDLDPHPTLLYNIGRAYDQAGELQRSLAYYGRYVEDPQAEPSLVRKANLALDRLRMLAAKEEESRQNELTQRRRYEAEARAARGEHAKLKAKEQAQVERETRRRQLSKTGTYLSGGAAVAGLGLGLLFAVNAGASKRAFLDANDLASKTRFEAETRSRALVADVSFAVALAGAVGAVLLYPRADEEESVALSISPLGGVLRGSF